VLRETLGLHVLVIYLIEPKLLQSPIRRLLGMCVMLCGSRCPSPETGARSACWVGRGIDARAEDICSCPYDIRSSPINHLCKHLSSMKY